MGIDTRWPGVAAALAVALCCLAAGLPSPAQATFPGEPGLIVFNLTFHTQGAPEYPGGLYAISPGAGQPRQLTDNPWDYEPSFAPSGRQLVFRRVNTEPSGLFLLDLTSGATKRITRQGSDLAPAFGRGGSIAFSRFTEHSYDLFLRTARGKLRRLTRTDRAREQAPVFSPDGERIFFVRDEKRFVALRGSAYRKSKPEQIYSIRTDGTGLRLVGDAIRASSLDTSPDGRTLAIERFGPGDAPPLLGATIWTKRLENGPQRIFLVDSAHPAYSPAGDEIAYWNYRGIWTFPANGRGASTPVYRGNYKPLEGTGALAIDPAWQPLP